MEVHLITGFPGFIASQLVRQLINDGVTAHFYAIVLAPEMNKAKREKEQIEAQYPNCSIELIEGDITLPNLGVDHEQCDKMISNIHVVWHLAAIYDLAVPREIAWKVNVHGTDCVNEFVKTLPNLRRYMYFSTAYVAGRRTGKLLETELVRPTSFKNYYEETKYEAELLVDDLKPQVPVTIIRPGIVRGNSITGETLKFDGPYFFMNLIDTLKWMPFIPFVGSKITEMNVVPIDYIFKASSYLCQAPEAEGKTLHLTDPNPHTVYEVFKAMVKAMTGKNPVGRFPLYLTRKALAIYGIRKRLGVEYETLDYLDWRASFDCSQAKGILQKGGITCPDFVETMPQTVKFYKENKHRKELHVPIK
ncbi:MAG: SDR family oxidoreductase [Lysinibacillus sp.]